jgi:hypothetical protein
MGWLGPSAGLEIHAIKRRKYETLLGFEIQLFGPYGVIVPIKLSRLL